MDNVISIKKEAWGIPVFLEPQLYGQSKKEVEKQTKFVAFATVEDLVQFLRDILSEEGRKDNPFSFIKIRTDLRVETSSFVKGGSNKEEV